MKILLFGGSGQVGQEFIKRARDLHFDVVSPVTSEVDITDEPQVRFLSEQIKPDVILNCAAYTAVDAAEADEEKAYEVNARAAGNVAESARAVSARLVHISTDYVYDGTASSPIKEGATVNPINVYGASKLAGDRAVQEVLGDAALIVRTSSVHGKAGRNIVHKILELLQERDTLTFVDDQIMSPTWAGWLSEVLIDLIRLNSSGIVNACCEGEVSWHGFASEVLQIASSKLEGAENKKILPVDSSQMHFAARRPAYSVLNTDLLKSILGRQLMPWQEGLRNHMREIGYE